MARPWEELVVKHDLVACFQRENIGLVMNLQEVGEHESCGPGNLPTSGFTYKPESFMAAGIGFTNLSWRDMGVPTLDKMMDIVQVMQHTVGVEGRRVAVHCHAGLGRTGLAIACFLIFSGEAASAAEAVTAVRRCRPGALQTQAQVLFVAVFEQYLQHLRCCFPVTDLSKVCLGRESYVPSVMGKRLSRSLSHGYGSGSGGCGCGSGSSSSGSGDPNAHWATATYTVHEGPLLPDLQQPAAGAGGGAGGAAGAVVAGVASPASPSPAALMAALDLAALGPPAHGAVMHARRLSGGGGSIKVELCGLGAIAEEGARAGGGGAAASPPVTVISTDANITEVYGDGLTIIKALPRTGAGALKAPGGRRPPVAMLPSARELGVTPEQLPWTANFHMRPEAAAAPGSEAAVPKPPISYEEALRRQQRLLHGPERRRSLRLHQLVKEAALALAGAARTYRAFVDCAAAAGTNGGGCCDGGHQGLPSFAFALLAALATGGRLPEGVAAAWTSAPAMSGLGLCCTGAALASQVQQLKRQVNAGNVASVGRAPGAAAALLLDDWFRGMHSEALSERGLELLVDGAEELASSCSDGCARSAGSAAEQLAAGAEEGEREALERAAAARALCRALRSEEQQLLLVLAAVLRHVKLAGGAGKGGVAAPEPLLRQTPAVGACAGEGGSGARSSRRRPAPPSPVHAAAGSSAFAAASLPGSPAAAVAAPQCSAAEALLALPHQQAGVLRSLCRTMARWLLGPLAVVCEAALSAVEAFLWFLLHDEAGYACLLQAQQQQHSLAKAHGHSGGSGASLPELAALTSFGDASGGGGSGGGTNPGHARATPSARRQLPFLPKVQTVASPARTTEHAPLNMPHSTAPGGGQGQQQPQPEQQVERQASREAAVPSSTSSWRAGIRSKSCLMDGTAAGGCGTELSVLSLSGLCESSLQPAAPSSKHNSSDVGGSGGSQSQNLKGFKGLLDGQAKQAA